MLDQKALKKIIKNKLEKTLKCHLKQMLFVGSNDHIAVRISTFSESLAKEILDKQEREK